MLSEVGIGVSVDARDRWESDCTTSTRPSDDWSRGSLCSSGIRAACSDLDKSTPSLVPLYSLALLSTNMLLSQLSFAAAACCKKVEYLPLLASNFRPVSKGEVLAPSGFTYVVGVHDTCRKRLLWRIFVCFQTVLVYSLHTFMSAVVCSRHFLYLEWNVTARRVRTLTWRSYCLWYLPLQFPPLCPKLTLRVSNSLSVISQSCSHVPKHSSTKRS